MSLPALVKAEPTTPAEEEVEEEEEEEKMVEEIEEEEEAEEEEEKVVEEIEEEEAEAKYEVEEEEEDMVEEEEQIAVEENKQTIKKDGIDAPSSISPILQSVNDLRNVHGALSEFVGQWNALQQTLDSIGARIDARYKELDALPNTPLPVEEHGELLPSSSSSAHKGSQSELNLLCETMGGKALRRYISCHLSEIERLRKEVPEALKLSPNPAKLVLDSMGRFYLQGRRAYDGNDPVAITIRRACILLLEFFILSGCCQQAEPSIKDEVTAASLAWRRRIIAEGGIESASAVDALGLVLFLASFGIPPEFGYRDLYNLLRQSNLKKKIDIFRCSPILLDKMPDIINDMITKELRVEAIDLIYAFGLEKRFPPLPLLSSLVQKAITGGAEERKEGQFSLRLLKSATEKQLATLKLVAKCLEDHKLDASEVSKFNINQKIAQLEKKISKFEQQNKKFKRKAEDVEGLKKPETRSNHPLPYSARTLHGVTSQIQLTKQNQDQRTGAISDSRGFHNVFLPFNMPEGGLIGGPMDRSGGMGLMAENDHGMQAGGWHGKGAVYESSAGRSLLHMPYSSGNYDFTGQSSYFPPQPLSMEFEGRSSGQNLYQFADSVLEHDSYDGSSRSNVAVPTATEPSHRSAY